MCVSSHIISHIISQSAQALATTRSADHSAAIYENSINQRHSHHRHRRRRLRRADTDTLTCTRIHYVTSYTLSNSATAKPPRPDTHNERTNTHRNTGVGARRSADSIREYILHVIASAPCTDASSPASPESKSRPTKNPFRM